mmetsp:Transcript_13922/g.28735  ORF Transcript_13922/g.28735 Transcript_13922/m.28735 type:complete len:218 (-) Transcript_13922:71-724(-)
MVCSISFGNRSSLSSMSAMVAACLLVVSRSCSFSSKRHCWSVSKTAMRFSRSCIRARAFSNCLSGTTCGSSSFRESFSSLLVFVVEFSLSITEVGLLSLSSSLPLDSSFFALDADVARNSSKLISSSSSSFFSLTSPSPKSNIMASSITSTDNIECPDTDPWFSDAESSNNAAFMASIRSPSIVSVMVPYCLIQARFCSVNLICLFQAFSLLLDGLC